MNSSPFKCSLFWLSIAVVAAAAGLWHVRTERRYEKLITREQARAGRDAQHATALLSRSFYADNFLTYSVTSKTTARMGEKQIASTARIVHAPHRLSIIYVQGDYAGLHSGYNQKWAWRQVNASEPMVPYIEMERPPADMAAHRFALLLQNYVATWQGITQLDGRQAEVVELHPFRPAAGAQGPAKKIWIDAQSGLTLRMQTFNYQMMPVMESLITEIDLTPQITGGTFVPPEKMAAAAQQRPWMAHDSGEDTSRIAKMAGLYPPQPDSAALPDGFVFDSVGAHRCAACGEDVKSTCYAALSRYTDGLNTLTIFALKSDCAQMDPLAGKDSKNGATKAFDYGAGTVVMRAMPAGHLIAVGDLPAPVLSRVLEATAIRLYNSPQ